MKKLFFLFALLASIAASATVTVTPLSTDFTNKKVTFKVEYSAAANNRAWIWIDLCPVSGAVAGTFSKAEISEVIANSGSWDNTSLNTRGFYVTASPSTFTTTLSNVSGKFNWCAHGSDYPPTAVINAAGGYTLKGTPPFTINGTKLGDGVKTFGAGTCITSITDLTGNPDGIVPALPSLSSPNSPSRCSAGAVTLSVTTSGGTTTAMTYTWNISGTTYTNQTNSYTTGSLSANTTYSVKVKNANNCESNTANGTISVNYPGTNGNPANATCGCVSGTTNCSGTCRTTGNYTTNDGACTGACHTAYVQLRNQCGIVIHQTYSTYSANSCSTGCSTADCTCAGSKSTSICSVQIATGQSVDCENCKQWCGNAGYAKSYSYSQSGCVSSACKICACGN